MLTVVQYLEPGPHIACVSPEEARARLRAALQRWPIARVLLGWNLPSRIVEACAEECARWDAELYLWQPLLTGDGHFWPEPAWHTIGLSGQSVSGHAGRTDLTFVCPNRPSAREAVLEHLDQAIGDGHYRGVFLDRIRFPSPASDPAHDLACFCPSCRQLAANEGLDLVGAQECLQKLLQTREGKRTAAQCFLSGSRNEAAEKSAPWLEQLLAFRHTSITAVVEAAAELATARGLKVGLDCYTPSLARLVGQDLPALAERCDWIKVMTYVRAYSPASIPFEILGLANWLMTPDGESESRAMACLADAAGWRLPSRRAAVRHGRLPAEILTAEIRRGRAAHARQLLAGVELVEIPHVAELSAEQIEADAEAVRAGEPDGVVLSWDLWRIPLDRLESVSPLYGG
jgi:hypothetical protein